MLQGERLVSASTEAVKLRAPAVEQVVQAPAPLNAIAAVQPPVGIQAPMRAQLHTRPVQAQLAANIPIANAYGPSVPPQLLVIPPGKR